MGKGEAAGKGSGEGWGEGEGRGHGMAKNGKWNHGVFSNCFPVGMCCLTCWCWPISACVLADKLDLDGFQYKYLPFIDFFGGAGLGTAISTFLMRDKVRERYQIPGDSCDDLVCAACCFPFVLCQMHNQADGN